MKKIIFLILLIIFTSINLSIAETTNSSITNPNIDEKKSLLISILNTDNYNDIKYLTNYLNSSEIIDSLVTTKISTNFIEFNGSFSGKTEDTIDEIKALCSDRFAFEISSQEPILHITLKKLEN